MESDGSLNSVIEFHDPDHQLKELGLGDSCDVLYDAIKGQLPTDQDANISVDDITSGDDFACRFSAKTDKSAVDQGMLTETDDTFILKTEDTSGQVPKGQLALLESMGDFSLTIVMPGDIVSAEGGKIDGNRATFTDLETLVNGITVEGKKVGDGSIEEITLNDSSSSMPAWIWVAIAGTLLLGIGALVFFIVRKKPEAPATSTGYANTAIPTTDLPTAANQPYPGSAMPGAHGVPEGTTATFRGAESPVAPNQPYPGIGIAGANGVPEHHTDASDGTVNDADQLQ